MGNSLTSDHLASIAAALLEARRTGRPVAQEVLGDVSLTSEDAYRIQAAVAESIGAVGAFKVGNKAGAPRIMAPIFEQDIQRSPATLAVAPGEAIGIELEVGFLVEAPLPARDAPNRRKAVARCLSAVPVIEIVRTRLPADAAPTFKLADNQVNGGLIVGQPVKDWTGLQLASVEATLLLGGEKVLDGAAEVPGGDAFGNFLVLEEMLGDHCGGLRPGQVVITGSLNGLPYVHAPIDVHGEIAGLGAVSLRLDALT